VCIYNISVKLLDVFHVSTEIIIVINWIGHTLRRNCLIKHVIEANIKGTRRQRKRCKQLLDDLKENGI